MTGAVDCSNFICDSSCEKSYIIHKWKVGWARIYALCINIYFFFFTCTHSLSFSFGLFYFVFHSDSRFPFTPPSTLEIHRLHTHTGDSEICMHYFKLYNFVWHDWSEIIYLISEAKKFFLLYIILNLLFVLFFFVFWYIILLQFFIIVIFFLLFVIGKMRITWVINISC